MRRESIKDRLLKLAPDRRGLRVRAVSWEGLLVLCRPVGCSDVRRSCLDVLKSEQHSTCCEHDLLVRGEVQLDVTNSADPWLAEYKAGSSFLASYCLELCSSSRVPR